MSDLHPLDVALKLAIEGEADWSERILRDQPADDPRVAFNLGWHELRHGNLCKGMDLMSDGTDAQCVRLAATPDPCADLPWAKPDHPSAL